MTPDELVRLLREACQSEGSAYRFAKKHGISESYIDNVLAGRNKPGPKIALALGFKPVRSFEPR